VVIKETSVFTRRVRKLLDDESYRLLQLHLLADPANGAVIPGSGGLRKVRWRSRLRGQRGGVRVIYYWHDKRRIILMLLIYGKNEQDDLTLAQRNALRQMVMRELQ
jgi:mRNA-degrading endonuclease RelE of RelBE toxin-antitoxin system